MTEIHNRRFRLSHLIIGVVVVFVVVRISMALFDLSGREIVFATILSSGLYLLFMVRIFGDFNPQRKKIEAPLAEEDNAPVLVKATTQVTDDSDSDEVSIDKLLAEDVALAPDEAQRWLDELLVKQQSK